MAKEYTISIPAHPSIYEPKERKINIFFCEPEAGINSETGILLLISGFGGNAESNVYKKMRMAFADKYNLVTVQCNYFGYEFMQGSASANYEFNIEELKKILSYDELSQIVKDNIFNIEKLLEIGKKYDLNIKGKEILSENLSNFNDMGIMQAIDNLTALLVVTAIIKDNNYKFNSNKIIAYGHSHGAYLCYLCNAFAPKLFSLIIDNSSWLLPNYLKYIRVYDTFYGKLVNSVFFDYMARHIEYDEGLLFLPELYDKFENLCKIVSFHGVTDKLISHIEKREFCRNINNCKYNEISSSNIDGKIFKSTNHGLDTDFLLLFDYVLSDNTIVFNNSNEVILPQINIETKKYYYKIEYSSDVLMFERIAK